MPNSVFNPCDQYKAMQEKWSLIHDLLGGTLAMRAAGKKWLPQEPAEQDDAYDIRLNRNVLFNAYADTIDRLVAKPFSKGVTVSDGLPDQLKPLIENTDRAGRSLFTFATDIFRAALNYGMTHILVDFPRMPEGATLADERAIGMPRFVHIPPPSLIGWGVKDSVPTHLRVLETTYEEAPGSWETQKVEQVRVIYPDRWELYRRNKETSTDVLSDEGVLTIGSIPLVTIYFKQEGALLADPPLEDLAWLNLSHWQSSADQRAILRFARRGLLFMRGLSEEDMDKKIQIGPNQVFRTTSETAEVRVVEHSGQAIAAGRQDLVDTEAKMETLGLAPLMTKAGGLTATGRAIDEARAVTDLQQWTSEVAKGLTNCFQKAAEWIKTTLPDKFEVSLFKDFAILGAQVTSEVQSLIALSQSGKISGETLLTEVRRRGLLSETLNIKDELERAKDESPTFGSSFGA